MSWIFIFYGSTDGGTHNLIRIAQEFSILKLNLFCGCPSLHDSKISSRLGSDDLEIISKPTFSMKLQPIQWKNGDVSQMRKHWHPGCQKYPGNSQLGFGQYFVLKWGHMKVLKTNQLYSMSCTPGKFPIADQICEWIRNFLWEGIVIHHRSNCMTNEPLYGDV